MAGCRSLRFSAAEPWARRSSLGLTSSGDYKPAQVVGSVRRMEVGERITETYGIRTTLDNVDAATHGDVVVAAFKPQTLSKILDDDAMRSALKGKVLISIAAGVRLATLADWLRETVVVRAMPNTPCLVRRGMTAIAWARARPMHTPTPLVVCSPRSDVSCAWRTSTWMRSPASMAAVPHSRT